jgi:hypothetical protein
MCGRAADQRSPGKLLGKWHGRRGTSQTLRRGSRCRGTRSRTIQQGRLLEGRGGDDTCNKKARPQGTLRADDTPLSAHACSSLAHRKVWLTSVKYASQSKMPPARPDPDSLPAYHLPHTYFTHTSTIRANSSVFVVQSLLHHGYTSTLSRCAVKCRCSRALDSTAQDRSHYSTAAAGHARNPA